MNSMQKCLILIVTTCASCFFSRFVWAEGPLALELQLKAGDPVQGLDGQIWRVVEVSSAQPGNTVLRVGIRQAGSYREAIVLKTSEGVRKIIAEGEPLPGGAGAVSLDDYSLSDFDSPVIQMNSRGAVALVIRQGVFLYQDGALEALAVKGQPVPGTGSSIEGFLSVTSEFPDYWYNLQGPYGSFLSSKGQIVFAAVLSDGRNGVFLASRQAVLPVLMGGDAVPGRQEVKLQPDVVPLRTILKGDHLTIVISDGELGFGVFHYTAGRLSTILLESDNIGGSGTLDYLASCDGNEKGTVALGVNLRDNDEPAGPAKLLVWSAMSGITKLLDASSELPGIENGARHFMSVSLDPEDRLAFAAEGGPTELGFYFWEKGNVEKIVAEGDPAPEGGAFHLEQDVAIPIPGRPGPRLFAISATNGRKEVAFMASGTAGGIRRPFLWSRGALLPIPVEPPNLPGFGGRPVTAASMLQLTSDGRLLVSAEGCCDHFQAVYTTVPAFPCITYIPLLAAGSIPGYSYSSAIQLVNRSHFTGQVLVEVFDESGQAEEPQEVVIGPGEVASFSLADNPFRRGYARVTSNGGAAVRAEALIRACHEESDFDLIVPITLATTKNDFVLDSKSQNTAVAVANPGSDPVRITARLFNRNRRLLATEYLSLAPHQQLSFLATDLFGSAAGGERRLRLESSSAFLAASFSLNGFRFTSLPEIPISSPAPPHWSLVNLYPGEVQEVTASARGTIAFATQEGRLIVVRDGIVSEVPSVIPRPDSQTKEVMLPKNGTSVDCYLTRIVGFREVNGKEEVLFIGYPLQGAVRLLAWDGEELRTVIELGKPLHVQTGRTLYPALEIAELNRKGDLLIAAMEVDDTFKSIGMWFLVHDGASVRPLFSIPPPTKFPSVAFNSSGQVALITIQYPEKKTVGFFDGQEYRTIAMGSQRLVDWWRATDFMQIGLSEDGTTFFGAGVRQTTETPRPGIFAAKNGVIRPVLIGSVSPQYSLAAVESPFQVNSRGNLAFQTRLATASNSYGSPAFLLVENSTLQTSVVAVENVSQMDASYARGFQWTDNNELFVSVRDLGFPESILYRWKDGVWTTVLDGGQSLMNTPGAVVSPSSLHSRIWPVAGFDSPIISVYCYGVNADVGLYLAVRGGVRELFFPQVVGDGDELSPIADLMVTNEGKEPAKVLLQSPDGNGGAYFTGEALLAGKEDRSIGISADSAFVGWLSTQAVGGNVDARMGLSLFEGTSDYVRLAVPFSIPRRESFTTTPPATFGELGLAFANPYSRGTEVTVELLKSGMEVERQEKVQIGPQGQRSIYVSELFGSQAPGRLLRIRSVLPIATFAAVQSKRGVAVQPVF